MRMFYNFIQIFAIIYAFCKLFCICWLFNTEFSCILYFWLSHDTAAVMGFLHLMLLPQGMKRIINIYPKRSSNFLYSRNTSKHATVFPICFQTFGLLIAFHLAANQSPLMTFILSLYGQHTDKYKMFTTKKPNIYPSNKIHINNNHQYRLEHLRYAVPQEISVDRTLVKQITDSSVAGCQSQPE